MRTLATLLLTLCMLTAGAARAGGVPADIANTLARLGVAPDSVAETPLPGVYEVTFGTRVVYLSGDGRYLLRGDLIDVTSSRNLTRERVGVVRRALLNGLDEADMIVFEPERARHTVTVFTDVDCGYCAKLHRELADYHALGIRIRYLAYPRAGPESASGRKIASVWCSPTPHQAMTDAKAGRDVPNVECDDPIARQYALGAQFGVRGTPTIVLPSGDIVPGYAPATRLLEILNESGGGSG